jgi:hypothetical protein
MISECATSGSEEGVEGPEFEKCDTVLAEDVGPCGLSPLRTHERTGHEVLFRAEVTDDFADDLKREHQSGAYITSQRRSRK